jgi:hypothetical protein
VQIVQTAKVARPFAGACLITEQILASPIRVSISDSTTGIGDTVLFLKRSPSGSFGPLRVSRTRNHFA